MITLNTEQPDGLKGTLRQTYDVHLKGQQSRILLGLPRQSALYRASKMLIIISEYSTIR